MSEEKKFIQFDREVITQLNDTTEAIILGYIIHEQISSIRNKNSLRKITNKEIAEKFHISERTASRVKTKLYEKNLLVEDSPIPNPRIGKLVWNEDSKSFDIDFTKIVKETGIYGDEVDVVRIYSYITAVDDTTNYFDYGFVKIDKEWFENPKIDITTKYWVIFFKAFEPTKIWTPTYNGIVEKSCWKYDTIKENYYKLRDEGWIHNDFTNEIFVKGTGIVKTKSYSIDFINENIDSKKTTGKVIPVEQEKKVDPIEAMEKATMESKNQEVNIDEIFANDEEVEKISDNLFGTGNGIHFADNEEDDNKTVLDAFSMIDREIEKCEDKNKAEAEKHFKPVEVKVEKIPEPQNEEEKAIIERCIKAFGIENPNLITIIKQQLKVIRSKSA